MAEVISAILSFYMLMPFVMWLVVSLFAYSLQRDKRNLSSFFSIFFTYFIFFNIGISFLYGFAMHNIFHEFARSYLGWSSDTESPFDLIMLAIGLVGCVVAFTNSFLKTGIILVATLVWWGSVGITLIRYFLYGGQVSLNFNILFWMNFLLPLIGIFLLWGERHYSKKY